MKKAILEKAFASSLQAERMKCPSKEDPYR
jgi:hypothetical protein